MAFDPSMQEVESDKFLWDWGQTDLHSEFLANWSYKRDPVSKINKNNM